jgi:AraC-like DNA-binding protein
MRQFKSAFCQVLTSLRVSGALVLNRSYQAPWAIDVPDATQLSLLLGLPKSSSVVPFHLVRRGRFVLEPQNASPLDVSEGEMIICTNGKGHRMKQGDASGSMCFTKLVQDALITTESCFQNGATEIICGAFILQDTQHNPLINSLPPIMKVSAFGEGSSIAIRQLFNLMIGELQSDRNGQSYMIERQLEMLYAEAIRVYCCNQPEELGGWLKAIHDPRIGTALNYIHNNVANDLSVSKLAKLVHMSSSRFAACFKEIIAQPPMTYVTQWRMYTAKRLLRESNTPISQLAHICGYGSLEAFNRAFNKLFSISPSKWRKKQMNEQAEK